MSQILHRHSKASYPLAVAGDGPYIIDSNGKHYFDACGGAAVSCLGHSDDRVRKAVQEQVGKLAYAHTGFFTNEPAEGLAAYLVTQAPGDIDKVYFVTGGSEANETALKLARQYFVEIGEPQRRHFIAREQSYHGNTMMTLAVGGNRWRKKTFEPCLPETHHIPPCYAYREQHDNETLEEYGLRSANELETKLLELGPETVIAFVAEPVVGATAGAVTAAPGYFKRIREICDQYGILLILDEIMCGMGRTGARYACEQEEIHGDIITLAKGLGAGYQPIGATLLSHQINTAIYDGSGFFQHGHTYIGHSTVTAAGLAVQQEIDRLDLLHNVRVRGDQLKAALEAQFGEHPNVGDIRGRGLFLGMEFVTDRELKTPFPSEFALHAKLKKQAMQQGLMVYPMPGTIDGQNGDHVLLAPPFIIDGNHVDEIVTKLSRAFEAALAEQ